METQKTSSKGKKIAIVILSILFVLSIAYIGYDKFLSKEKTQKTDKEIPTSEEIKKLDKDDEIVKKLFSIINTEDCPYLSAITKINDSDVAKIYIAYQQVAQHDISNINCNSTDSLYYQDRYYCGSMIDSATAEKNTKADGSLNFQSTEFKNNITNRSTMYISENSIKEKMQEIFGKDIEYKNEDVSLNYGCSLLHFDNKNKGFIEYSGYNCGGTCTYIKTTLDSISQDGNKLNLKVKLVMGEESEAPEMYNYEFKLEKETNNYIFVKSIKES